MGGYCLGKSTRKDAVWNGAGYYEAPQLSKPPNNIKIDLSKCTIIVTRFGFYDLHMDGKKIKRLSFKLFQIYKTYVIDVLRESGA